MLRFISFFFFAILLKGGLLAQNIDSLSLYNLSLEELSKVPVYSTTRIQSEEAASAPANVIVITEFHIRERGYKSLLDIFEGLPDFKVDKGVDPRWQNDVTIRGKRYSDKFLILIDGVRISSPTNEIIPIFENYPLYMAEQVEIVYGPSSALYGADAFAGVVNIVTRKAQKKPTLYGSVSGGMYSTFNSSLFLTQEISDDWSLSMGGSYFYDKQPDLSTMFPAEFGDLKNQLEMGSFYTSTGDTISPRASIDPERGNPLEAWTLYGNAKHKNLSIGFFKNYGRTPTSTANAPNNSVYNDDQYIGHNVQVITGKYGLEFGKTETTSQLTYSTYRLDPESNFRNIFTDLEPAYLYARSRKLKFEQLLCTPITEKLKFTTGFTFERFYSMPRTNDLFFPVLNDRTKDAIIVNSIAPNNLSGIPAELISTSYNNIGALTQIEWDAKPFKITMGARVDKDDRFDLTINPRVGLIYHPVERFTFKALYGTAYLAPSPQNIYDRFGIFKTDDEGDSYYADFFQLPNENLEPQTVSTSELHLKYFIKPNFCVDLSGYYSKVTNSINPINSNAHRDRVESIYPNLEYTYAGTTYPIGQIQINDNLGESDIFGSSITLNYLWRANPYLTGDFFIISSFIGGNTDIDEGGLSVPRNLPGVSTNITRLGATLKHAKFSANARLSFISDQRTIEPTTVQDNDSDDNQLNDDKYQELDGYHKLDINLVYILSKSVNINLKGTNVTNQKFRNVNIGADPEGTGKSGAAVAEFQNGAPQNPIRLTLGVNFILN